MIVYRTIGPQVFHLSLSHPIFYACLCFLQNEEIPIENEGARVVTTFLPLKVYGDISDAQGQLTPQSMVGSG